MIPNSPTIPVPIKTDEHGVIRVSGTRVTLDILVARFKQGVTPDLIHEGFPTVPLNDIYAVITYYLANQEIIDQYLNDQKIKANRIRKEMEAEFPPQVTMADLQERFNTQKKQGK